MISVIICTYNRDKYLYHALSHVACNTLSRSEYEIVLVNNNSTDHTEQECRRFATDYPDVAFHYHVETKQGLSHARNRGMAESRGEYLVFLDDDSFVRPEYLENLSARLRAYPDVSAWGGRITPMFESGKPPKWWGSRWTVPWVSAIDMGDKVCLFERQYPIGANMGVRRSVVEEVGLFNTELGRSKKNLMAGEEKDFFNRIRENGGRIYYFPDIDVQHVIPPSRTTRDYIVRLGNGVGRSERLRCKAIGRKAVARRWGAEMVKWGGTMALWGYYMITFRPAIANYLVLFRWQVSKGLACSADIM